MVDTATREDSLGVANGPTARPRFSASSHRSSFRTYRGRAFRPARSNKSRGVPARPAVHVGSETLQQLGKVSRVLVISVGRISSNCACLPANTRICACWVQILNAPIDLRLLEKEAVR